MRIIALTVLAAFVATGWVAQAYGQMSSSRSDLIESGDWQLVYANCIACHSLTLVTAQRGDASYWRAIVHEMQTSRNMWALAPDTEEKIVTYLAEHYPSTKVFARRPPLSQELLPKASP